MERQDRSVRAAIKTAVIDSFHDATDDMANRLRDEGANEQESIDMAYASAMLLEAGVTEQQMLMLFNRYWNTSYEEGRALIARGHLERLSRYLFDIGLRGARSHYFLEISGAAELVEDTEFTKQKLDKQYAQLLSRAQANDWEE